MQHSTEEAEASIPMELMNTHAIKGRCRFGGKAVATVDDAAGIRLATVQS
jgi:hypothetical protein